MTRRGCKQRSINHPEFRPHHLPTQDLEFLAQHQQLDASYVQAATATKKGAAQSAHGEVEKGEGHAADIPSLHSSERRQHDRRPSGETCNRTNASQEELALRVELCSPELLVVSRAPRVRSADCGLSAGILAAGPVRTSYAFSGAEEASRTSSSRPRTTCGSCP